LIVARSPKGPLPYRLAVFGQAIESPLRGIKHSGNNGNPASLMSRPQAALRTSALVMASAFPHHAATMK
jgi:hypothetical protein